MRSSSRRAPCWKPKPGWGIDHGGARLSLFRPLLRVAVEHSYNSSGFCSCLDFHPTARTSRLIANLGLLCKITAGGIQIAQDVERRDALELLAQGEQVSFDFKVFSSDPDFKSYSEPFDGSDDGMLYFDNRAAGGDGAQDLALSGTVSDKDMLAPEADELDGLLSPHERLAPPVFVLRLFTGAGGELLQQWLEAAPRVYAIRFTSRQRYWKYFLLGRMLERNGAGDTFSVGDADATYEFEATGEEKLSDQRLARTFRSKQPIPLQERYSFQFQLRQRGPDGETILISRLPFASVGRVGKEAVAERETIVSEIYINS